NRNPAAGSHRLRRRCASDAHVPEYTPLRFSLLLAAAAPRSLLEQKPGDSGQEPASSPKFFGELFPGTATGTGRCTMQAPGRLLLRFRQSRDARAAEQGDLAALFHAAPPALLFDVVV